MKQNTPKSVLFFTFVLTILFALFLLFHLASYVLFLIFLIVFFLLSYKILQYLAGFRFNNKIKYSDFLFTCIFFILLFIPMSHISSADRSKQENRMLAAYPQAITDGKANLQYAEQFEKWFNDHFFGRNLAFSIYKNIIFRLNKYYNLRGFGFYKDNWAFNHSNIYSNIHNKQIEEINKGITAYQNFCDANNIKCYLEIVPRKLEFAKDKQFRIIPQTEKDKAEIIKDYVFDKTGFNIIYPLDQMKEANTKDLVYFKTDHHWTDTGAFIGYQELMKEIKKDFPDLIILTEEDYDFSYSYKVRAEVNHDFQSGSTCKALNLSDTECPLYTPYKYYTHKKESEMDVNMDKETNKDFYTPYAPNKQKVMLIGNSFVENISYFFASTFENVFKRRCGSRCGNNLNFSLWKDEIINKNVDIIIFVLHSENSHQLNELKD